VLLPQLWKLALEKAPGADRLRRTRLRSRACQRMATAARDQRFIDASARWRSDRELPGGTPLFWRRDPSRQPAYLPGPDTWPGGEVESVAAENRKHGPRRARDWISLNASRRLPCDRARIAKGGEGPRSTRPSFARVLKTTGIRNGSPAVSAAFLPCARPRQGGPDLFVVSTRPDRRAALHCSEASTSRSSKPTSGLRR